MTDLLNLEQRAGQIEAEEDPPRLRQQTQPIAITRLQKALRETRHSSNTFLQTRVSYCLAISRDRVGVFKLAIRTQIGKQVDQVVATVRKNGAFGAPETALYAALLGPAETVVSAKARLIIIPDGPLHALPFEVIGPTADRRLLSSHIVTYAPSGTVFTLLSEKEAPLRRFPCSRWLLEAMVWSTPTFSRRRPVRKHQQGRIRLWPAIESLAGGKR